MCNEFSSKTGLFVKFKNLLLYVVLLLKNLLEMLWEYNMPVQRKEFQKLIYSQNDHILVYWNYVSHTDALSRSIFYL